MDPPTREEAFNLLTQYNSNPSLITHGLAVEATMRFMAKHTSADAEQWGIIGLVHDLDYEQFPSEHCKHTEQILRENGWPEEYIRAVLSHGWGICTEVEPLSLLEKTLFTVDELTGLITACALIRPSKSVLDLERKSVLKKWKQASFAAGVDREVIRKGAAMLGREVNDIIDDVIAAMRQAASELGLGSPA